MSVDTETEAATTVAQTNSTSTKTATEGGSSINREEVLSNQLDEQIQKGAKYRQANSELKARIVEYEKDEQRKAQLEEEHSTLKTTHRQELALARLEALATKEGLVDTDDLKLIDLSVIKYGENGKPENLAEVLASFKEAKPHKFGSVATSSAEKAPKPEKSDKTPAAKALTDAEFSKWMSDRGA